MVRTRSCDSRNVLYAKNLIPATIMENTCVYNIVTREIIVMDVLVLQGVNQEKARTDMSDQER